MNQNEATNSTVFLNGEQPKQMLTVLAQKAQNLRWRLEEANEAGDGKAFQKLTKELKATEKQMKQVEKSAFDIKKVLDNLSGASIKDLTKAKKELDKQLSSPTIVRNSKEWKDLQAQLKSVKNELVLVNNESKVTDSGFGKLANGINKYFAIFTTGLAAVTGLTLGLKKFMDARNELEDSKANLKALTGLGDNDIEWLTDQAKLLSSEMTKTGVRVRASAKEIVDAFTIVGSAKPELLKDRDGLKEVTEAALVLATASKMQVVDTSKALTIAMNMYGASAKEAAKYTNVLGAGAKEGAAEVSSQTESILKSGVAASRAKIPIEQLVGSIQALADKGIKDEIAGTGLKTFFIKLQSGANETNPAVVGLQTALENLEKQHLSSAQIQKRFGLETFTVAAAMIDSAKKVDFYTKAVTGTNVAWEQAAINSNTVAARMAQAQNAFSLAGQELVKNLNPALLHATDFGVAFLKMLVQTPKWLSENRGLLATLATTMTVYTIAVAANTIVKKANDIATKALDSTTVKFFKTLLSNPYVAIGAIIAGVTVAIYKFATAQTDAQKAWKQFNAESQQQSIELNNIFEAYKHANEGTSEKSRLLKIIKEQYGPYIKNLIDEKGNITDIEKAQSQANTALRDQIALKIKNAAINELTTKEIQKQSDIFGSIREEISKQKGDAIANIVTAEIGRIYSSSKDMNNAFKESFSFMQKYGIDSMNDKGMFSGSLTDDLRNLGTSFYKISVGTRAIENQFVGIIKNANNAAEIANSTGTNDVNNDSVGDPEDKVSTQKKELDLITQVIDNAHTDRLTKLKAAKVKEKQTEVEYNNEVMTEDVAYYNLKLDALEKFKKGVKDKNFLADINKQINELKDKKAELDVKFQERINKILLDSDPVKKENLEYDDRLRELGLFNKKREKMTSDELSVFEMLETQHQDNLFKIREKADSMSLKQAKDKFDKEYSSTKEAYDQELELLSINAELSKKIGTPFSDFKNIDSDPEIILIKARIKAIKSEITARENAGLEIVSLNKSLIDNETNLMSTYLEKFNKRVDLFSQFGDQIGTVIGDLANGSKDAVKSSLVSMIDMGLDYLKAQAEMAIAGASIQSLAQPDSILTFGASGLARAAILTGLIEIAFATAKTVIGNAMGYSEGGFTEPGDKYKPAGIVHAGEFVANQNSTYHTPFRKVFNLVDHAQKTNTVARITPQDISRAVGIKSVYSADNYSSPGAATGANSGSGISSEDLAAIKRTMQESNAVNTALLAELKKGIVAKYKISGNDGVVQGIKEHDRLLKNAGK